MPYADFTKLLTEIQQKNLGQGLILQAQAQMMANQDKALSETLAQYNASMLDLDKKFKTTSEQLEELNKSDIVQEGGKNLEDLATSYMAILDMATMQQMDLRNIVDTAKQRLINIGTPEALNQAQSLETSYGQRIEALRSKAEIPLKTLQFKKNILDSTLATLNVEEGNIKLQQLKNNISVMDNVAKVIADTDRSKYPNWIDVLKVARANNETGEIDFTGVFQRFLQRVENDKDISPELKPQVISVLYSEVMKNVRHYNPPSERVANSTGIEALVDDLNETTGLYQWLKKETQNLYEIFHSDRFAEFRQTYKIIADEYIAGLQEQGRQLDAEQIKQLQTPGRNFEVLKRYVQAVKNNQIDLSTIIDVGLGLPNTPDGLATYLYNLNFNPNSEIYYWRQLDRFKKKVGIKKITPLFTKKDEETGTDIISRNVWVMQVPFGNGSIPFDLSAIMSNDEGYYLPSYGNYPPNTEPYKPEKDIEPGEKPKKDKKEVPFNYGLFERKY